MKNKIIIALSVAAICLSGCEDAIDIFPVSNNTADQFYASEYEMNQAVIGIYARLARNGTNTDYPTDMYYQAMESRSDNLYFATLANAQRDQVDMRNFQCTDVTSLNQTIYARLYQIIADANTLLDKSSESYSRMRAEARFLRALAYFDLVRAYGPQPILEHATEANEARMMDRSPIADVYAFIISDLEFAASNLEDFYTGNDLGRVGAIAAKCLLGEVYVNMAGYPLNDQSAYAKAVNVLQPIMNVVDQRFAAHFSDVFNVNHENEYDLFSVQFASGNQGLGSSLPAFITNSSGSSTCFPEWVYGSYNQQGQDFRVDTMLVNKMAAEGDLRLDTEIAQGFWTTIDHGYTAEDSLLYFDDRCVCIKFLVKDNTNNVIKAWNDYPLNFPRLRPADAYLLYAEALLNTSGSSAALPYINKVRSRAGLAELNEVKMSDIMDERRREFLGEGKRYFDLVRQGESVFLSTLKAFSDHYGHVKVMGATDPSKKDMLLPIPLSVMNIQSTWEQNYGY